MCIACNIAVAVAMFVRKPFLFKANNNLELLLLAGEICLWVAGMGNELLADNFSAAGDAICLILEWVGVAIFAFAYGYCVYEGMLVWRTKVQKIAHSPAAVVPETLWQTDDSPP